MSLYLSYSLDSYLFYYSKQKEPDFRLTLASRGSFLSSQAVSHQLLSALRSLTTVFGMGTGVSFLPLPPHSLLELARSKLNIFYQVKTSLLCSFGQVLD
jgi:hypothetical protein